MSDGNRDSAFARFAKVNQWGIPVMISMSSQGPEIQTDERFIALLRELGMRTWGATRASDSDSGVRR